MKETAYSKSEDLSEIYRKAFIEGARYGYNYHLVTAFPGKTFDENCKGNASQKAISKNPFHALNEIDE